MPPDPSSDPTSVLVTTHLHTDGPIPGPHSLLTLISTARTAAGIPAGRFSVNLRELPGATLHPAALRDWRTRAGDWLATRRSAQPPAPATIAYVDWVRALPGPAVLVVGPEAEPYLWLYWYLHRFAGQWPFAGVRPVAAEPRDAAEACTLASCRSALAAAG